MYNLHNSQYLAKYFHINTAYKSIKKDSMKRQHKYVILGGGTTAGYAVKELIEQKVDGENIAIISAENTIPMNRPPLSKGFLKEEMKEEETYIGDESFYNKNGVNLYLNSHAKEFNPNNNTITIGENEVIEYQILLIATGASPIILDIPGKDMDGIHYLRSVDDSKDIMKRAQKAKKAVVVGGSYIATETAAALHNHGVKVTMVYPEKHLLGNFAVEEMGVFFDQMFKDKGIELVADHEVTEFHGKRKVKEVRLKYGKEFDADMVVVGVGVKPNIDIFEGTGLELYNGIVVNEYCETNFPNVFAAGDVARFPDKIYGGYRRIEHWENAFEMGKTAAHSMIGYHEPYVYIPFFFSDIFDFSYEFYGDASFGEEYIIRGDINKGNFSVLWFKESALQAAFLSGKRPEEETKKIKEWILNRTMLNTELLERTEVPFEEAAV